MPNLGRFDMRIDMEDITAKRLFSLVDAHCKERNISMMAFAETCKVNGKTIPYTWFMDLRRKETQKIDPRRLKVVLRLLGISNEPVDDDAGDVLSLIEKAEAQLNTRLTHSQAFKSQQWIQDEIMKMRQIDPGYKPDLRLAIESFAIHKTEVPPLSRGEMMSFDNDAFKEVVEKYSRLAPKSKLTRRNTRTSK
jgi:hypothetical protein